MQTCNTYKTSGVKVDLSNCDSLFLYLARQYQRVFIQDNRSSRPIVPIFKWCLKYKHETLWHVGLRAMVLQWPSLLWVTCLKRLWALSLMLIHCTYWYMNLQSPRECFTGMDYSGLPIVNRTTWRVCWFKRELLVAYSWPSTSTFSSWWKKILIWNYSLV